MKINIGLLILGTIFGLSQLGRTQCPEICNDNFKNTALGFEALQHSSEACVSNTAMGYQASQIQKISAHLQADQGAERVADN